MRKISRKSDEIWRVLSENCLCADMREHIIIYTHTDILISLLNTPTELTIITMLQASETRW